MLEGGPEKRGTLAAMNRLKVKDQQTIVTLYERGWPVRKIARELGLDRATVRRYIGAGAKSPTPRTGSLESKDSKSPGVRTGSWSSNSSLCEPWTEQIKAAYQSGLSIERIYQDLVCEHGFSGSYD